jgi:hypothetical protein
MRRHPITKNLYRVLMAMGFEGTYIYQIIKYDYTLNAIIELPPNKEINDLIEILPNIQQQLKATDVKLGKLSGKKVIILFGLNKLDDVPFNNKYIHPDTLKIELPSSYGSSILDFSDGASCHLLNGGAPRMGKTMFLLYVATLLYIQTNQQIELHITSPKAKDFYPLFNLPNITISKDEIEFESTLDNLITEYKIRNELLYSPQFKKATDAKSIKEHYPDKYYLFKPIFLIIDEYARFSDNRPIQKKVAELVQTAGYVNVHIIIATQRPDARNTLPANVKMGLMARICFKTADKNNSIVILDEEGAELLPNTKGRAILKDGDLNTVQVPHMTYDKCEQLLNPYRKELTNNDTTKTPTTNESTKRQINPILSNKIQNLFKESDSQIVLQPEQQPNQRNKQSNEASNNGWFRLASQTTKG